MATNHFLNQWQPIFMTHVCLIRPQTVIVWSKIAAPQQIIVWSQSNESSQNFDNICAAYHFSYLYWWQCSVVLDKSICLTNTYLNQLSYPTHIQESSSIYTAQDILQYMQFLSLILNGTASRQINLLDELTHHLRKILHSIYMYPLWGYLYTNQRE